MVFPLYAQVDTIAWEYVVNQPWNKPTRLDFFINIHPRLLLDSTYLDEINSKINDNHQFMWEIVKKKVNGYLISSSVKRDKDLNSMTSRERICAANAGSPQTFPVE
jgi:hypothetical protein